MNRMTEELPVINLLAGQMYWSDRPTLVTTILGSCLSVVLYSRRLKIGGICHGFLPACTKRGPCGRGCAKKFSYVDCAIRQMLKTFDRLGVERNELEAKCFGGADLFSRPIEKPGLLSVGRQNSAVADEVIKAEGLTWTSRDVGGLQGRKVLFYTHTGDVLVKRLKNINVKNNELLRQLHDVDAGSVIA
jgi:chemotaxis protein CheD